MVKKTREDIDSKAGTSLASTGAAGLLPTLDANTAKFLGADLVWHTIAAGGDMAKATYDPDSDGIIAAAQLDPSMATTASATVLITTHAGSTAAHIGGAGTVASIAASTALITTHAGSTDAHIGGAGTVLSMAAGTVLITTHAGSTAAHIGGAGTVLSVAAGTALITTHASSTDAHIGGAGTVLSTAAATVLISTHNSATTSHGITWIIASSSTVTGTAITNITGFTFAATVNSNYDFEAHISNSASHTTGIAYAFGFTGSNASVEGQIIGSVAATTAQAIALTTFATKTVFFNKATGTAGVMISGLLKTAGTAGTFSLQHCAGSAAATATVRTNSVWRITNITAGAK
jgi:hypothetical protein